MSRLEEILEKNWQNDDRNEPLEEMYYKQTEAIQNAMREYARECCIATQKACEESAMIEEVEDGKVTYSFKEAEYACAGDETLVDVRINKESILKESNIILL